MAFTCPRCDAPGPFQEVIEVTSAIEVTFVPDDGSYRREIPDGAEAVELDVAAAGYRCVPCTAAFDRPRVSV